MTKNKPHRITGFRKFCYQFILYAIIVASWGYSGHVMFSGNFWRGIVVTFVTFCLFLAVWGLVFGLGLSEGNKQAQSEGAAGVQGAALLQHIAALLGPMLTPEPGTDLDDWTLFTPEARADLDHWLEKYQALKEPVTKKK